MSHSSCRCGEIVMFSPKGVALDLTGMPHTCAPHQPDPARLLLREAGAIFVTVMQAWGDDDSLGVAKALCAADAFLARPDVAAMLEGGA